MRSMLLRRASLVLALTGVAGPDRAVAQHDAPPPPAAYVLPNVTLVGPDGARRARVTIIVRGAFIEAIGTDAAAPPDAERLAGDSLFVYPGIVDAQGQVAHEFPRIERDPNEDPSWAPSRPVQGFLPHRRVADHLTASGAALAAQRKQGVVAAAVHPDGPVMPGRGALLLFRPRATRPAELVIAPELGPVFSFEGANRAYPATHFGVIAFLRQSFEDARHDGLLRDAHAADPRGLTVPAWDADYGVLRAALAGATRVFFEANGAEEIRQVLDLASEYGFRPVIVGGGEAWRVARQLREARVPVLVSLDFPKPERWKPEGQEAGERGETAQAEPQPLDAAAQREKERLEHRYANAGRLAAAGVSIALTSGGGKADIREGARKAIEYGLAEAHAVAAVSRVPAELLGAPYLARVERGHTATFIVTDGPLFAEDTKIRYTFVEGALERDGAAQPGDGEPAVDVAGAWTLEVTSEGQVLTGTMTLTQEGGTVTGRATLEGVTYTVEAGRISGRTVSFTAVSSQQGETIRQTVEGTVRGDQITGSGGGPSGSFTWRARRSGPSQETSR